jgi:hypothetical protein
MGPSLGGHAAGPGQCVTGVTRGREGYSETGAKASCFDGSMRVAAVIVDTCCGAEALSATAASIRVGWYQCVSTG